MVIGSRNGTGEVPTVQTVNQVRMAPAGDEKRSRNSAAGQSRDLEPNSAANVESAADAASGKDAVSQPMTTTTSSSSNHSHKDGSASGPSPYGTRSRNRPGVTRPNYAEDTELDFELSAPVTNGGASKRAASPEANSHSPSAGDGGHAAGHGGRRKRSVANGAWNYAQPTSAKNADIPGTSTFSAVPSESTAPTASKKRKATHAAGSGNGNGSSTTYPATQTLTRRASHAAAANASRETNMLTFEKSKALLRDGKMIADDGSILAINDHVYLVCEPPGDPYYLCRIMEFIHNDPDNQSSPVDYVRVNWYYRPRDVQRYNNDTRLVYGTMHSDVCPITSLRGKCQILHRSEIEDLDEYRRKKDCFWFNQIFDRFIHRWYEVIPTSQIINVPEKVKKALDERWKYIAVETGRVKELTSAVKLCKRCSGYCATNESVECAVCHNTYHMNCVRPPLLKKPSRGFAWACGPCSRAQERKLEARRTPIIGDIPMDVEEEEVFEEEEEDASGAANTTAPSPSGSDAQVDSHPGTQAEIALAKMWPMRYLGIHCRVEDALQYDDRAIYPRASSRLGPRHQANVNVWYGRPIELVKPAEIKKKYVKTGNSKKETKLSKETIAALEADRAEKATRPKWIQDEPPGYVRRGEDIANDDPDNSARLLFSLAPAAVHLPRGDDDAPVANEELVDSYIARAKLLAKDIGVKEYSTNFLDKALQLFTDNKHDAEAALKQLRKVDRRKDLHEPELTKEELKRFEDGVARYGSELRSVRMHVKTLSHADTVRFWYIWKKTLKGQEIWGSYGGRKGTKKKVEADAAAKLLDDIADDYDDSAFDNEKAVNRKRGFQCKFCSARKSRQWRRAPGVAPGQTVPADGKASSKDKSNALILALCQRCAGLWRKYAIKWENIDEVAKKVAQGGGKAWRKKMDEEYLQELMAANEAVSLGADNEELDAKHTNSTAHAEPPRKKAKSAAEKDTSATANAVDPPPKKKEKPAPPPRPPTPPIVPTQPKFKDLPCAVCQTLDPSVDQLVTCKDCRLTVHRGCYGIGEERNATKWVCDMCMNDRAPQVSMDYKCVLCPVVETRQELLEPPKPTAKKKNDREREKERLEKELATQFLKTYIQKQKEKGRPDNPREALKRTVNNNWVHVTCAVWTSEVRFSRAINLEAAEGISRGTIPAARYDQICKLCKTDRGACVNCHHCHTPFHVACAQQAGYILGFDITPVKGSRRDHVSTVTLGTETGFMTSAIWCKEHAVKTIVHPMHEINEESGLSALQLFVRTYKQADLTFTGTVRKANLVNLSTKAVGPVAAPPANRRVSTANSSGQARSRASISGVGAATEDRDAGVSPSAGHDLSDPKCAKCGIDVSPKWWKIDSPSTPRADTERRVAVPDASRQVNGIGPAGAHASPSAAATKASPATTTEPSPAPAVQPVESAKAAQNAASLIAEDAEREQSPSYQCHKCHWKELHPGSVLDEPIPMLLGSSKPQSPPRTLPSTRPPWFPSVTPSAQGLLPALPPPHLPTSNVVAALPQLAPHLPVPQQYNGPVLANAHHNGYNPLTSPPVLTPAQVAPARPPAYSSHHPRPPAPLALSGSTAIVRLPNGLHSPGQLQQSPTNSGEAFAPQQGGSPFSLPSQHIPTYGAPHGSPRPLQNRPTTPRDSASLSGNESRPGGGASASPSLRNLLH